MAAPIKGSATGTMQGQDVRPTEMERLAAEGAQTAQKLLAAYTTPPAMTQPNPEDTFTPLVREIQNSPNPAPLPLPAAPTGGRLLAGLLATNIGGFVNKNPQATAQTLDAVIQKLNTRESVARANVAQQNQADSDRQYQLLQLREKILSTKLQQEMDAGKATQADKTAKELLVVQTALSHVDNAIQNAQQTKLTGMQLAAQEKIAKMNGLFDFLSRLPRALTTGDQAGGGMSPDAESNEINKLVDFTNQIDLKLQPDKGLLGFGPKTPSDEEMSGFMRTFGAYLSSPSQRVRQSALYFMQGALQDRFKDNQQAKLDFLQKYGLVVLQPTVTAPQAQQPQAPPVPTPPTTPPPTVDTSSAPVDSSVPFTTPTRYAAPAAATGASPEQRKQLREMFSK